MLSSTWLPMGRGVREAPQPPSPHIQVAWDLRLDAYGDFINLASYGKIRPERIIRVKARAMLLDALEAFIDLASYGKDRPVSPALGVQVA